MRDAALVQRKLKDAFYGLGWGNTPAQCAFILNAKANNVASNRAVYGAKRGRRSGPWREGNGPLRAKAPGSGR